MKKIRTLLSRTTLSMTMETSQKAAKRIVTCSETTQHADIDYRAMLVADRDAEADVINTLRFHEAPTPPSNPRRERASPNLGKAAAKGQNFARQ